VLQRLKCEGSIQLDMPITQLCLSGKQVWVALDTFLYVFDLWVRIDHEIMNFELRITNYELYILYLCAAGLANERTQLEGAREEDNGPRASQQGHVDRLGGQDRVRVGGQGALLAACERVTALLDVALIRE
jgi:hypothetical protein